MRGCCLDVQIVSNPRLAVTASYRAALTCRVVLSDHLSRCLNGEFTWSCTGRSVSTSRSYYETYAQIGRNSAGAMCVLPSSPTDCNRSLGLLAMLAFAKVVCRWEKIERVI